MELRDILVKPLMTEKSVNAEQQNVYVFEVSLKASKFDIKEAISSYFGVEVVAVRTLVVRGKEKRFGRFMGKRSNWKKAYVQLAEGQAINTSGEA